jgi:hypothetical protein
MNERELIKQLQREGFGNAYVWEDSPHARYPDHTIARKPLMSFWVAN